MIDLAPNNKRGLTLKSPVMLAAGFAGYADEYGDLVELSRAGAIVTMPTTLHRRVSSHDPRVVESRAGFLLSRGGTNPGLGAVLQDRQRAWKQLDIPVIFALAAEGVNEWSELARRLERVHEVAGVELEITEEMDAREVVRAVRQASELPILAKIPIARAVESADECMNAGVDSLVIGSPPRADAEIDMEVWKGRGYGAGLKHVALRAVRKTRDLRLEIPLVACGGIHSLEDTREFFALGVTAVQLDSVLWLDPRRANEIIVSLSGSLID